ncbi:MAG: pseudouridine synthase [Granulosicoccaceae bacterium]
MRLDKYLAHASGASRKQVKQWIKSGRVSLQGRPCRDAGAIVPGGADVTVDGDSLRLQGKRYIMLNKPAGSVSTAEHADERSVFGLLPAAVRRGLHVVGRLDVDTTGLLLLTDDGAWSHRITAPSSHCLKQYRVQLADPIEQSACDRLLEGVMLHDEKQPLRARALSVCHPTQVDITLGEGRYHQVKRMFAAVDNHVVGLHRLQIGELRLDSSLAEGEWRHLSEVEVDGLRL